MSCRTRLSIHAVQAGAENLPHNTNQTNKHTILQQLHYQLSNTCLRQSCAPMSLTQLHSRHIRSLFNDMKYTIHQHNGVGLAAPQIGVNKQVFIANLAGIHDNHDKYTLGQTTRCVSLPHESSYRRTNRLLGIRTDFSPTVLINPKIIKYGRTIQCNQHEGCFSIPQYIGRIPRCTYIRVEYVTIHGDSVQRDLYGWNARIFLHEFDHLHGKLFIDYLSNDKQLMHNHEYMELLSSLNIQKNDTIHGVQHTSDIMAH